VCDQRGKTADQLYRTPQDVGEQLDRLAAEGRLSKSSDATNAEWGEVDSAVAAARTSIDVAVQALARMETAPVSGH
jgi:hypothetical protein